MTPKEITEGNRIIAEFMGWKVIVEPLSKSYPNNIRIKDIDPDGNCTGHTPLNEYSIAEHWSNLLNQEYGRCGKYHSSWDWLMPSWGKLSLLLLAASEFELIEEFKNAVVKNDIYLAWKVIIKGINKLNG